MRLTFDLGDVHMHGKIRRFPDFQNLPPVSWSTKIEVGRNRQNKTDFQNLSGVAPPILGQ
jgi:hypothetical protein